MRGCQNAIGKRSALPRRPSHTPVRDGLNYDVWRLRAFDVRRPFGTQVVFFFFFFFFFFFVVWAFW